MDAADRNRMYDTLSTVANDFPDANLQLVAVGLGATSAEVEDGSINIRLADGSGFVFIRES